MPLTFKAVSANVPNMSTTITENIEIQDPFVNAERVTVCGYSDRQVCQVIKRTKTTLTLRTLKATLLNGVNSGEPDALQFSPGGFIGHTSGNQRWKLEEDENGTIYVAHRQHKPVITRFICAPPTARVAYKVDGNRSVVPGEHPHYDFNF